MIVEGHTGATDPHDYWQALADNRALLICRTLEQHGGVPSSLVKAIGVPGGGALVRIYPAGAGAAEHGA